MLRFLIHLILFIYSADTFAGNARQISLGNTGTTYLGSTANYANPAGLAWIAHHTLSTTVARHHLIPALDQFQLSYSRTKTSKSCAIYYSQTGDMRLQIQDFSLTYAQLFSDKFSLALRPRIGHLKFGDNYGQKTMMMIDVGMITKLNDKLIIGFYLINAGRSKVVNEINERYASAIITGLSYTFSELLTFSLEIEKYARLDLNSKLGLEYRVSNSFLLRGGFQSAHRRYSAGFGYRTKKIDFDSAIYYTHPTGYSLVFGISLNIEKRG